MRRRLGQARTLSQIHPAWEVVRVEEQTGRAQDFETCQDIFLAGWNTMEPETTLDAELATGICDADARIVRDALVGRYTVHLRHPESGELAELYITPHPDTIGPNDAVTVVSSWGRYVLTSTNTYEFEPPAGVPHPLGVGVVGPETTADVILAMAARDVPRPPPASKSGGKGWIAAVVIGTLGMGTFLAAVLSRRKRRA